MGTTIWAGFGRRALWLSAMLWLIAGCDGDESADPIDAMATVDGAGGSGGSGGSGGVGGGEPMADAGPDMGCVCPGQQTCDAAGACVEPETCVGDDDCLAGRLCFEDACRAACLVDGDCGDGERCHPEVAVCVADDRCMDDGDCPTGACEEGECVAPCVDGMCPGRQMCDPATGDCMEPDDCADDLDCIADRICLDGACATPCGDDADCPGAQTCAGGQCAEPAVCAGDADCAGDRLCTAGACADPCGRVGCTGGLICDGGSGRCDEADPCADDGGCFPGRRCDDGRCVDPCGEDADCPGVQVCREGMCVEPSVCDFDAACGPGRICADGMCMDGCPAMPCPDGAVCDAETGRCAVPGGCEEAADCAGAQRCEAGRCVEPAVCNGDPDCLGDRVCRGGLCRSLCDRDVDCEGAQRCEGGLCVEGPGCVDDDACLGGRRCHPALAICVEPCPGGVCPGGLICGADGLCAEPAICADEVDCAGDRICRLGRCFSAGPDGPCLGGDCPVACVDFACADAVPGACDCPDGWGCIDGSCAAPGPCGACPDGWHCAEDGLCLRCLGDDDCPGGGVCEAGVCHDPAACAIDDDCLPGHRCPFGRCEVDFAACDDDPIGQPGPDVAPLLPPVAFTGLRACDGVADWFRVGAAGGPLRVTVRFARDAAPPRVRLFPAADPNAPLFEAAPQPGEARVAAGPGDYLVEVRAAPGASVTYGLQFEDDIDCAADRFERPWPNDDRDRARVVAPGVVEGTLCVGDEDWFRVEGDRRLRVAIEGATADVDGQRAPVEADGPLTIRVSALARADYRLSVTPVADPAAACAGAEPLALGVEQDATVDGGGDDFAPACRGPGGAERVFALNVPRPGRLTADLRGGGGALLLYRDCAAEPVACSAAAGGVDAQVEAGPYRLVVDGPFQGTVRVDLAAASPLCDDPEPLAPGPTVIRLPLGPAQIDGACTDPDLGAVVRRIDVAEAAIARLSLDGGGAEALVSIRAACADDADLGCGLAPGPAVAPRLEPGAYFAVIQGEGEVTANLALEPAADLPGFADGCGGGVLALAPGADLPLEGDLTGADDTVDLAPCGGQPGGADAIVRFRLEEPARVSAFIEQAAFGARLAVLDDGCAAISACSDPMLGDVTAELAPGVYGLVMEANGLGGGPFRVRLRAQ